MRWRKASFGGEQAQYRIIKSIRLQKKYERAKKRKISQAVQRETPLRSRFPFSLLVCVAACACLAERSDATCHRQAHAVVSTVILSMCSPSD